MKLSRQQLVCLAVAQSLSVADVQVSDTGSRRQEAGQRHRTRPARPGGGSRMTEHCLNGTDRNSY